MTLPGLVTLAMLTVAPASSQGLDAVHLGDHEYIALVAPPSGVVRRSIDAREMLRDINRFRIAYGLVPLVEDPELSQVAEMRAADMMNGRYIGHVSPTGQTPYTQMEELGVTFSWAGENLALDDDESSAFTELSLSPGHRDNMLEEHYARVGIAAITTSNLGELFVQEFAN